LGTDFLSGSGGSGPGAVKLIPDGGMSAMSG